MQRTNVVRLMPSKRQEKILKECMLLSSCVYNSANYVVRQQFFKGEKVSNFRDLQVKLQGGDDYRLLGRSYALPRLQVYGETNSARFKLIKSKSQRRVGLPKYFKNRKTNTTIPSYLVIDNCQYSIGKKRVLIPLSRAMHKKYSVKDFRIGYSGVLKWEGKQARGQIHFRNHKFYLYQSVDVAEPKLKTGSVKAGVDLGIKRVMAVYLSTGEDKVIGSKRFFKHWQYLTNIISAEQSRLALWGRKSSRRLEKLFDAREVWQENLFNNVVAKLFRFLNRTGVSELVVGNVKGILENNDKGRLLNQMSHNYWAFDKILQKIKNKAEEYGIILKLETEEYTSRTCPVCGDNSKSNCQDRIFVCDFCGFVDDRDVVGARNILFKSMCGSGQSTHWCEIAPLEAQ